MVTTSTVHLTDATFEKEVLGAGRPVLVDFWAKWCAPCRAVAPVLEQLAAELADRVTIAKVDVDECPIVATRFRIQSIPTFVLFEGSKVLGAMQGAQPKARFLKFIDQFVPVAKGVAIGVAELDALIKSGQPVAIVDIRDPRDFARSHLRHAVCVAPDQLETELARQPRGEAVVLVCRTGEASRAEATRLAEKGFAVRALEKGLLEWEGSQRPTYSNDEERDLDAARAS